MAQEQLEKPAVERRARVAPTFRRAAGAPTPADLDRLQGALFGSGSAQLLLQGWSTSTLSRSFRAQF